MKHRFIIPGALLALAALALSGCAGAPRYWYNTQKDAHTSKADLFQCEEEAAAFSRNMGDAGSKNVVQKRLHDCMELRGYLWITEDELPKDAPKLR